jgi:Tfp pilus assembly protein PilN
MLLVAGIMGGIYYAIDYKESLRKRFAELQQRTQNVSQLRIEVGQIEEKIEPIKDFPRQEIVSILDTLNAVIPKDSWITNFQIKRGVLKLEGYSPNPSHLSELLSEQPQFMDVGAGSITKGNNQGDKFTITIQLNNFDFETYEMKHFPDQNFR